jgi:hypothetical protein
VIRNRTDTIAEWLRVKSTGNQKIELMLYGRPILSTACYESVNQWGM